MTTIREVSLSPQEQGPLEEVFYKFDFAKLGTPSNPICYLHDVETGADLSATNLKDSPSVIGTIVTSKKVYALPVGKRYKLEVLATVGGNGPLGGYLYIDCK